MASRREFLGKTAVVTVAAATAGATALASSDLSLNGAETEIISLCGKWRFQVDPENAGTRESWFAADHSAADWHDVDVPHTWQVDLSRADYRGIAWYRREFEARSAWREAAVRVEFEAVFHTATLWVNGQLVGEHLRKGYTAFAFDVTPMLRLAQANTIAVRVDSAFNEQMLPRGRSSDWANDGGIFRPVQLLVTPKTYVERIAVDTMPDLNAGNSALTVSGDCKNASGKLWRGTASFQVIDAETGLTVLTNPATAKFSIKAGASQTLVLKGSMKKARLWHFDSPNLYRLQFSIANGNESHQLETTFGVRKFEIKDGQFHLNGERIRLMGVERMAGSNPAFGMAEPTEWMEHDQRDLKYLNCVFTRVHWPQDKRVLDYCDRHGILMQTEVPAWGYDTFQGMGAQPDPAIMENGLEQLREMIARDRNHPSVVVWGLCNEISGQNPPAYQFAKRMLEEAKRLDPGRLCSYASNSLDSTPARDVAGLMDFIETNEYFGTWAPGSAEDAVRHLDQLHVAFPGKPIVISEYGYCACTPDRPEGDEHRIGILRTHDAAFRSKDFVGGAIFFCYNDYRTHVGDRGVGALQHRVHGVVDVYGAPKSSYTILREESSPVESLTIENQLNKFHLLLKTRNTLPAYTLRGYKLLGVFYSQGNIPVELQEVEVPELAPDKHVKLDLTFKQSEAPLRVQFDLLRPTGFSACSVDWKP
ncbi:MAG TPA: glycoside hydrolase family 2 TIM barrel-domain containing protein [Terriglobales bacterium]|nr:glycoside hydrolase family 2 TIM barrel-domain containing protein [Terriglobales bacterium]